MKKNGKGSRGVRPAHPKIHWCSSETARGRLPGQVDLNRLNRRLLDAKEGGGDPADQTKFGKAPKEGEKA